MAEPARKLDWDEDSQEGRPRLESLQGGGVGDGKRAAEGKLYALPKGEASYDDSSNNTEVQPDRHGLHIVGGNPDAVHDASSAKPELHALNKATDGIASPKKENTLWKQGKPYSATPGMSNTQRVRAFFKDHRKGLSIGGILTGGSIGAVIFGSTFLLPLKIDFMLSRLDSIFGGTSQSAMSKMSDKLFNKYIAKYVLPGINKGLCKSTIEPGCVEPIKGTGPVARLYEAWRQDHYETKLAKDYGIIFGKDKTANQLYMVVKGKNVATQEDLMKVMDGKISVFEAGSPATIEEADQALRDAIKGETLWKRVFLRFTLGKFTKEVFGVRRCILVCKIAKKVTASVADRKLAVKVWTFQNIIDPVVSEGYARAFSCALLGIGVCEDTLKNPAGSDSDIKLTAAQQDLQDGLRASAAAGADDTEAILADAKLFDKGIVRFIMAKLLSTFMDEAAINEVLDAADGAGLVIMVVQIAAKLDAVGSTVGATLRHMDYAVNAAAAAKTYMQYATVDDEMKGGNVDPVEFGSFMDALGTNLSGSATDRADFTTSPLYGALFGGSGVDPAKTPYKCNDGSSVPSGKLVCPEENLVAGNSAADFVSAAVNGVNTLFPFLPIAAGIVNWISDRLNDFTGFLIDHGWGLYCNAMDLIPPGGQCSKSTAMAEKLGGQFVSGIFQWVMSKLIPSPFTDNMSGGRTFDMIAAGTDVVDNKSCQVNLGCAKQTDQQVLATRNQMLNEEKSDFQSQPLMARLFSTDTPYSLLSQAVMATPANLTDITSSFSNMLADPFGTVATLFGSMFDSNRAFAADLPLSDPFGVIQYGYSDNQIPDDPEAYWDQNCQGQDFTQKWMDTQTQDDNTGEAVSATPEPCILIQTMVQANGTVFDSSLAPPDSLNPDPPANQ